MERAGSSGATDRFGRRVNLLAPGVLAIDSDQDGVPDFRDRCPDEPGDEGSTDGCPRGRIPETVRLIDGVPATSLVTLEGAVQLHPPAMPPYDLTPAAQGIC